MKFSSRFSMLLFLLAGAVLAGCSLARQTPDGATLDAPKAYETVNAILTLTLAAMPASVTPATPQPLPSDQLTPIQPAATATVTPLLPTSTLPPQFTPNTPTPTLTAICDRAAAGYPKIDVTIDDNTVQKPGQAFTKIWRLTNVGTCTWTNQYSVRFSHGDPMGANAMVPLAGDVAPGQTVEIAVDMVAPTTPGTYRGNWKLSNPAGVLFGLGPAGDAPFWVQIVVVAAATQTPTLTAIPSATLTPSYTPSATITPSPTPETQASGTVSLALNDTLDLDTAQPNAADSDLAYQSDGTFHLLAPQAGATMGVYGGSQPSREACLAAATSAAPIAAESLTPGTYLCYRTSQGRPGWLRLSVFDPNTTVTLDFLTWVAP